MTKTAPVVIKRTYPWNEKIDGHEIVFRLMTPTDKENILELARRLSSEDLTFLRMEINKPQVVEEWVKNLQTGRTLTVLAEENGKVVGYASLHHNELLWTSHLGELRVLVDGQHRGTGIGRRLAQEIFHVAREMKLDRVIVQIPAGQARVRQMLEQVGFQSEAILPAWLKDPKGQLHDLLIMSHPMEDFGR